MLKTFFGFLLYALLSVGGIRADENALLLSPDLRNHLSALPSLVDRKLQAEDFRVKAVIVSFFASWCPPCRAEFAQLNQLVEETSRSDVTIVAVNVFEDWFGKDEARLQRFLDEYSPQFHVLRGNEEIKQRFLGVERIPTLFVFDASGSVRAHFSHLAGANKTHLNASELKALIQSL